MPSRITTPQFLTSNVSPNFFTKHTAGFGRYIPFNLILKSSIVAINDCEELKN